MIARHAFSCHLSDRKRPAQAPLRRDEGKSVRAAAGNLAGIDKDSYSAAMNRIVPLVLGGIVLAFCVVVYFACRSWRRMSRGRRIASVLLLVPHFLLVVCLPVSILCGQAPQGSPSFNAAFFCDVLALFILPVPALVGTSVAVAMFMTARTGSSGHPG